MKGPDVAGPARAGRSLPDPLAVDLAPTHPAGLRLRSPVLTASGTFGFGDEYRDLVDYAALGAVVTKTVTPQPRDGNPTPRTVETPAGMLNSIGLPNAGVEAVLQTYAPVWERLACPVIVSISADDPAAWAGLASRFARVSNVAALEANLSCPNVAGGLDFSVDPAAAEATCAAIVGASELPVIAKLSPNVTDIRPIARAVQAAGVHAISLINTIVGLVVDVSARRPFLGAGTGGVSGPAIRPIAVRFVYETAQVVSVPVIGIGGVATTDDALQFLMAGASAVQVGSTTFRDPLAAQQVVEGLSGFVRRHRLGSVGEIVGAALPAAPSASDG